MENYPFEWKLQADRLEMKVRWSIFIITAACAGLPALVWSVRDLIHHRKNGHRTSVFIILLLLTDFVELLLSPYILLRLFIDVISLCTNWTCWVFLGFMVILKRLWYSLTPAGGARGNSLSEISTVYCFCFLFTSFYNFLLTCVSLYL